jgi:PAS domain S-box-containing protein
MNEIQDYAVPMQYSRHHKAGFAETEEVYVLLVDDDRSTYLAVRAMLSVSRINVRLDWQSNFDDGLAALRADSHDICLIDYYLDDRSGVDLMRLARSTGSDMPVIMLTGNSDGELDVEAMSAGFDDFLVKGQFDSRLLERAIRYSLERRRAAEDLRRSEEYFRLLIENVSDVIMVLETSGRIRFASPSVQRVLGYDPEMLIGRNAYRWIHRADRRALVNGFNTLIAEPGRVYSVIYRILHRDGSWRYLESVGRNLIHEPLVQGIVVSSRDVTDRLQAEDALRESEERYRRIVETAQEGIWVIDAAGVTTFANARIAEMLGYRVEEMVGRTVFEFSDAEGRMIAEANLERRKKGIAEQHDFKFIKSDGTPVWAMVNTNPIYTRQGGVVGALAMVADITARKEMEDALKEAKEQLECRVQERTAELALAMRQLEEAHMAQKRFVADASHDLRTPLTVIRGEIDLLLRNGKVNSEAQDSLTRVIDELKRLETLANDLLMLARLDAASDSRNDRVRLDELLIGCVEKLTRMARQKDIRWGVRLGDPVELTCDAYALDRAISNVLENAIKYSPPQSLVDVSLATIKEQVVISISDNGPGIHPSDLPYVFDRFYRSDQMRATQGTGLGLSIVKSVIEAHDGQVLISSSPGVGTTVKILLDTE